MVAFTVDASLMQISPEYPKLVHELPCHNVAAPFKGHDEVFHGDECARSCRQHGRHYPH